MVDIAELVELGIIAVIAGGTAIAIVTYLLHAGWNRSMTSKFRDEFLDTATSLAEGGELPVWAVDRLHNIADHLFSRRELYRIVRVLIEFNTGKLQLNAKHRELQEKLEASIPGHLRHVFERTLVNGLLATTGAEPIMGAIARSQFLMMGKATVSDNGPSIELDRKVECIETALPAVMRSLARAA